MFLGERASDVHEPEHRLEVTSRHRAERRHAAFDETSVELVTTRVHGGVRLHEHLAPVLRIGDATHVALLLETVDRRGDRPGGQPALACELARRHPALVVEEVEASTVQTLVLGGLATGIGLAEDLRLGLIERFRSLPMARSAVLVGRTSADLVRNLFVVALMCAIGFAVDWRPSGSLLGVLAGIGLVLLFAYAMSWVVRGDRPLGPRR